MLAFSTENVKNNRIKALDLLRGLAVLLVIFRHWNVLPLLSNLGWLGVDLFFVISGFLISNLLFSELDKNGRIDLFRFFIRRGLKIYPLFLLLLILTLYATVLYSTGASFKPFLFELFFLQNYAGGLYVHTWSLAVEEHFYVLLLICFSLFISKNKNNVLPMCIFFMAIPLLLRIYNCLNGNHQNHFYTHTRIDSLFAGVLFCYGWRYYRQKMLSFRQKAGLILPLFSCLILFSFGFINPESYLVQGPGFTVIAFACAGLLLYGLGSPQTGNGTYKIMGWIGFYSYAIYLAHIPVKILLEHFGIVETTDRSNYLYFITYALSSILAGVVFSELVEQPVLRWRDRKLGSKA